MTTHYLPDDIYSALIAALAAVQPDEPSGEYEPHCFVEVLGEIGGIWPASIQQNGATDNSGL